MAKNDDKKRIDTQLNLGLGSSYDRWNSLIGDSNKGMFADWSGAKNRDLSLRDSISQKYQGTGMAVNPNSSGWFDLPAGMGGGGGFNSSARGGYEELSKTGGINRGDFASTIGSYENMMKGGVPNADAIRYRATSQIPSFYEAVKNDSERRRNIQGGYSPGFDAQMQEITRQAGRESYHASRMAEADIADRSMQAMQFGTQGLGNLYSNINQMELTGKLAGLGGIADIDKTSAMMSDSASNRNLAAQLKLQEMYQSGNLASADGLRGLYSSTPGESGMYLDALMRGLGGMDQSQIDRLALMIQNRQGGGNEWWKSALGAAATGIGAYYGSRYSGGR